MTTQTFNLRPEKLEDDLILITPLESSDFDRLFAVASDPLIWELHPIKDRYKKEIFREYFDTALTSNSSFLVFTKATNELIGSTRFYDLQLEFSKVAIGYTFLARKYWGGEYNKAMKKLLLDHAFTFVNTVVFHIGVTNFRSQKAILKIGAKKVEKAGVDYHEKELLNYEYEIRKSEYAI